MEVTRAEGKCTHLRHGRPSQSKLSENGAPLPQWKGPQLQGLIASLVGERFTRPANRQPSLVKNQPSCRALTGFSVEVSAGRKKGKSQIKEKGKKAGKRKI